MYKTYNAINKVLTSDKDDSEKKNIISSMTIGLSKIKIGVSSARKILNAFSNRYDTYDGKSN
tara:strand:- start:254 stop:439 length:186 start_codon:yes stop_codon:yes gene_type:complete